MPYQAWRTGRLEIAPSVIGFPTTRFTRVVFRPKLSALAGGEAEGMCTISGAAKEWGE